MKITGGQAKGIPIKVAGKSTVRPATDSLRQAVFSSIANLVPHSNFLDLFAGTGAYGLEAWSRGASGGLFVEKDHNCLATLSSNINAVAKSLNKNPFDCSIFHADVFKAPIPHNHQFNLIFADPPYDITETIFQDLLNLVTNYLSQSPSSRFIIETPGHLNPPEHKDLTLFKKLGKNTKNTPAALIWQLK